MITIYYCTICTASVRTTTGADDFCEKSPPNMHWNTQNMRFNTRILINNLIDDVTKCIKRKKKYVLKAKKKKKQLSKYAKLLCLLEYKTYLLSTLLLDCVVKEMCKYYGVPNHDG